MPRAERYSDDLRCEAGGKVYYIHNQGKHASLRVANSSGKFLFFPGTESEQGAPISLKKSTKTEGCSLSFSRSSSGLRGFRLCLGEGETHGSLHVNGRSVNVSCEQNGPFHENVADSIDDEGRQGRKKHRRHASKAQGGKKGKKKHQRRSTHSQKDSYDQEDEEADNAVDPGAGSSAFGGSLLN